MPAPGAPRTRRNLKIGHAPAFSRQPETNPQPRACHPRRTRPSTAFRTSILGQPSTMLRPKSLRVAPPLLAEHPLGRVLRIPTSARNLTTRYDALLPGSRVAFPQAHRRPTLRSPPNSLCSSAQRWPPRPSMHISVLLHPTRWPMLRLAHPPRLIGALVAVTIRAIIPPICSRAVAL